MAEAVIVGPARRKPLTALWLAAVMLTLFALQIALYAESFHVKPVDDDFAPPLADMWRAQVEGPWVLFTNANQPLNYRPLQSLTMWMFAGISVEHQEFWIRVMHIVGMAVFALAAGLWFRAMPISRMAALIGAVILFVHPAMVAPFASIDGYGGLFSTGFMWLSVYTVWAWRDRLWAGLPIAIILFLLAFGFKEYSLGAVPLACLGVLCFARTPGEGVKKAFIVGASFSLVVLTMMWVRTMTMPPGAGMGYFMLDPVQWLKNASLFGAVLLFPGSSTWVFLNRAPATFAIAGAAALTTSITLLMGLLLRWRAAGTASSSRSTADAHDATDARRWLIFSLLAVAGASFPAVLIFHVSEMYALGMVVPLTMLVALAADGCATAGGWRRAFALIVLVATVVWMAFAVRAKVSDLRATGELSVLQLKQILAMLPPDAHDLTVAVWYPPHETPPPKYSVYISPDDVVCRREQALNWLRPHRNLRLEFPEKLEDATAHAGDYALILRWNRVERKMQRVEPGEP